MNINRFIKDLNHLKQKYGAQNVTWDGGGRQIPTQIHIKNVPAKGVNKPRLTVKIPVPANIYQKLPGNKYVFYRDIFISGDVHLVRNGREYPIPRYWGKDKMGWAFLCIHPDKAGPTDTIETFIRVLQIFLNNIKPERG